MNYRNESQDVFFLTIFVDVEETHLVCGVEVLVEVGVPGGRVHRVVLVVLGDVLRRRLGQYSLNGAASEIIYFLCSICLKALHSRPPCAKLC